MIVYSTVYSDADQGKHQSSVTGEFPAQMASNAENVSIWWRHHVLEIREADNITSLLQWRLLSGVKLIDKTEEGIC